MNTLEKLQQWYLSQCNSDWEHQYGMKIGTLDNPGWQLSIDLAETHLENESFDSVKVDNTDTDWVSCWVDAKKFEGRGGPTNLNQMIEIFLSWANSWKSTKTE